MKSIMFMGSFLFAVAAFANGPSTGGGGEGVVCRRPNGTIVSVELLDLWEARTIYGRRIPHPSTSSAVQLNAALDQLKLALDSTGMASASSSGSSDGTQTTGTSLKGPEVIKSQFYETVTWLESKLPEIHRLRGVNLAPTGDVFETVTPKKPCQIEQVIRYQDLNGGDVVLINQDLVDHMDKTNRAALLAHEGLYHQMRPAERSSIRVRRAIGLAFSGFTFSPLESLLPDNFYVCWGDQSEGILYQNKVSSIAFLPLVIAGRAALGFETPIRSLGVTNSIEALFAGPEENMELTFGSKISFDYQYHFYVGGKAATSEVRIQPGSWPDQTDTTPYLQVMSCKAVSKADFLAGAYLTHL